MSDGLTLISLISSDSREPGSMAHSRAWRIPHSSAEAFATVMTERYGAPIQEGLSTVASMVAAADTNAEAGFLFTDGPGTASTEGENDDGSD